MSGMAPLQGSGLAENALVRKGFRESLLSQVLVPKLGEAFVFCVELRVVAVMGIPDKAAPLLNP
jgi:hypothetical protein